MKKINVFKKAFFALIFVGSFSALYAQKVETLPVGVTARLATQLSVTKVADVDFGGIFIPVSASATATFDNKGVVSITNGTTTLYNTELQRLGEFYITADKTSQYAITYPNQAELALKDGVGTLNYTPLLYDNSGAEIASSASVKYTVGSEQYKVYKIGGSLLIPGDAKAGLYNGVVNITITWE